MELIEESNSSLQRLNLRTKVLVFLIEYITAEPDRCNTQGHGMSHRPSIYTVQCNTDSVQCEICWHRNAVSVLKICDHTVVTCYTEATREKQRCVCDMVNKLVLKGGYGICETPADFENTQLKWSYPLSFNTD